VEDGGKNECKGDRGKQNTARIWDPRNEEEEEYDGKDRENCDSNMTQAELLTTQGVPSQN
jgi:hypothetical protein